MKFSSRTFSDEKGRKGIEYHVKMSNIAKTLIHSIYQQLCVTPSDINEHLPTLKLYASKCDSFIEAGVRTPTSQYAIASGLCDRLEKNPDAPIFMVSIDLETNERVVESSILLNNVFNHEFHQMSDLDFPIDREFDAIFIDTFHVYGHLKRELEYFHKFIKKFIIMHDTEVDKIHGEVIRMRMNLVDLIQKTGYSHKELTTGLGPAIEEFLKEHGDEWEIGHVYTNNNGLTILVRKDQL